MRLYETGRLTDAEIVAGLRRHDAGVEKYFFDISWSYFDLHFNQLFFDQDSRREVFQTAMIKLWTEIENGTITLMAGKVCRRQPDRTLREMTASLTTFMMAFAKNEFRELLRNHRDNDLETLESGAMMPDVAVESPQEDEEHRIRIVDECILSMSPNCVEILTLFYYQKKTLDEIMALRGERNGSKDGLKTAKNKCMVTLRKRVLERLKTE